MLHSVSTCANSLRIFDTDNQSQYFDVYNSFYN